VRHRRAAALALTLSIRPAWNDPNASHRPTMRDYGEVTSTLTSLPETLQ